MAEWHLKELRDALEERGWTIISVLPGDDYAISASWEIQRNKKLAPIFIDFDGFDDLVTLPIEQSYGCHIRGHQTGSLRFTRRGERRSASRQRWREELESFARAIDRAGA